MWLRDSKKSQIKEIFGLGKTELYLIENSLARKICYQVTVVKVHFHVVKSKWLDAGSGHYENKQKKRWKQ